MSVPFISVTPSPHSRNSRISPLDASIPKTSNEPSDEISFGDLLRSALDSVNRAQWEAEHISTALALGDVNDIHQVTIATEKANLALQLTISIRNRAIEAYQEISRMQL